MWMTQVVIVNCSSGFTGGGGVHFHTSFAENRLIDCHIQGCHTMDAWATGDTGGLSLWNGHLTMIGGSITGCRAKGENGGAGVLTRGTLTLANVLVADCVSYTESGGGGGIGVQGNLIMSGHPQLPRP